MWPIVHWIKKLNLLKICIFKLFILCLILSYIGNFISILFITFNLILNKVVMKTDWFLNNDESYFENYIIQKKICFKSFTKHVQYWSEVKFKLYLIKFQNWNKNSKQKFRQNNDWCNRTIVYLVCTLSYNYSSSDQRKCLNLLRSLSTVPARCIDFRVYPIFDCK